MAILLAGGLALFTASAVVKHGSRGNTASPEFILPLILAPLFGYLSVVGAFHFARGGQIELVISSSGVRCRNRVYPWSRLGYIGPSGADLGRVVVLTVRRAPLDSRRAVQAFLVLDRYQPIPRELYLKLVEELRPFLSAEFPHVQVGSAREA
jgi:hypothetical protein